MNAISEREMGRLEQDIENLKHRAKNDRTILMALNDEIDATRRELAALKVRLYTTVAVTACFVSGLVWVLEFAVNSPL